MYQCVSMYLSIHVTRIYKKHQCRRKSLVAIITSTKENISPSQVEGGSFPSYQRLQHPLVNPVNNSHSLSLSLSLSLSSHKTSCKLLRSSNKQIYTQKQPLSFLPLILFTVQYISKFCIDLIAIISYGGIFIPVT